MKDLLIPMIFALMHSVYVALLEGFLVWGFARLCLPDTLAVSFWLATLILLTTNFIYSSIKFIKLYKE